MRRVYLIRHGLPDFPNGERMCLGHTDIPLGAEGREQARVMAEKLPPVAAVFSSPLSRAVQTAQAIGLPITIVPDLRELYAGAWDGLTFREITRRYPELYAARGADPLLPLPEAEDHGAGAARFREALETCVQESAGDIAVVAHGGVMAAFLSTLGGPRKKPAYTQVIPLTYENGIFRLEEENHA